MPLNQLNAVVVVWQYHNNEKTADNVLIRYIFFFFLIVSTYEKKKKCKQYKSYTKLVVYNINRFRWAENKLLNNNDESRRRFEYT